MKCNQMYGRAIEYNRVQPNSTNSEQGGKTNFMELLSVVQKWCEKNMSWMKNNSKYFPKDMLLCRTEIENEIFKKEMVYRNKPAKHNILDRQ